LKTILEAGVVDFEEEWVWAKEEECKCMEVTGVLIMIE
jgi:hypothetical protein